MSSHTGKVYELAKWIDKSVIAEAILEQDGVETVEQAQQVWLNFLKTELSEGLGRSAQVVLEKEEPGYAEAEKLLSDWNYRSLPEDGKVVWAIGKGLQAIRDCLEMKLDGKGE